MNASFIFLVSGFSQDRGAYHGILKLREELYSQGFGSGSANRIIYLDWRAKFDLVAQELSIICNHHGYRPRVLVAGYSYGGWGALELCREFQPRGIDVESLNLSDPVGRPRWWPRPLPAATSLLSRDWAPKLFVPGNVQVVHSFFQRRDRPQGHKLRTTNGTRELSPVELDRTHKRMDDAPEFHKRVLDEARLLQLEF